MLNFVSSPIFNILLPNICPDYGVIEIFIPDYTVQRIRLYSKTKPMPHISKIFSVIVLGNKNIFAMTIDPVKAIASFGIMNLYVSGPLDIRFACFPYVVRDCLRESFLL